MPRRVDLPSPEAGLRRMRKELTELARVPGRWIYVGASGDISDESPAFQNSWSNSGGGFAPMRFRINKWRVVEIEGAVEGGAIGTVIFTLPTEYRPDYSLRFACAGDTATTVLQVDPNGDVTQVS